MPVPAKRTEQMEAARGLEASLIVLNAAEFEHGRKRAAFDCAAADLKVARERYANAVAEMKRTIDGE